MSTASVFSLTTNTGVLDNILLANDFLKARVEKMMRDEMVKRKNELIASNKKHYIPFKLVY